MKRRLSQTIFAVLACAFSVLFVIPSFSVQADDKIEYIGFSTDGFIDVMPERGRFEALDSAIRATFQNRGLYENFTYEVWQRLSSLVNLDSYVNSGDVLVNVYFTSDWNSSWTIDSNFSSFGINTIVFSRQDYFLPTWQYTSSSGFYNDLTFYPFVNGIPFNPLNNYFTSNSLSLLRSSIIDGSYGNFVTWDTSENTISYNLKSGSSVALKDLRDWLDFGTGVFVITFRDVISSSGRYVYLKGSSYSSDTYFSNYGFLPSAYSDFVQMFPVFDLNSQYEITRFSTVNGEPQYILDASDNIDFSVPMLSLHNPYFIDSDYPGLTPTPIIPTPTPFPTFIRGTPTPQAFPSAFPTLSLSNSDIEDSVTALPDSVLTIINSAGLISVFRDLVEIVLRSDLGSFVILIVSFATFAFVIGLAASGVARLVHGRDSSIKTGKVDEPIDALTYFEHKYYDND